MIETQWEKTRAYQGFCRKIKSHTLALLCTKVFYIGVETYSWLKHCMDEKSFRKIRQAAPLQQLKQLQSYRTKQPGNVIQPEFTSPLHQALGTFQKTPDITVIIPAYQVEDTIEACVNSVFEQAGTAEIQCIVVDDGATDETSRKLDQIEEKFRNTPAEHVTLQVIHEKNQGLSGARNTGLGFSQGTYIFFLDSDDRLLKHTLQEMYELAEKEQADLVVGGYETVTGKKEAEQVYQTYLPCSQITTDRKKLYQVPGYAWGKLYHNSLWQQVHFPVDYEYEDTVIPMLIYPQVKKAVSLKKPVVAYAINPQGLTASMKASNRSLDSYWIIEWCLKEQKKTEQVFEPEQYVFLLKHFGMLTLQERMKGTSIQLQQLAAFQMMKLLKRLGDTLPEKTDLQLNFWENQLQQAFLQTDYRRLQCVGSLARWFYTN